MTANREQILSEDMDEAKSPTEETAELLNNIKQNGEQCLQLTANLLSRLNDNQLQTQNGNSLMELKNRMFLSYLIDLTYLVLRKINREQIGGSDVVKRLVENRTVLERMRPIEHKLKYTFDKLIKTSNEGILDPNDPLSFKPKLNSIIDSKDNDMAVDEDEEGNDEELGEESETKKDKVMKPKSDLYVPPKVAQMRFEEEEDVRAKALERAKKRALNSSIIAELKREFNTGPEEISHSSHSSQNKIQRFLKEKTAFEEEYMTRMNLTKKQRNDAKKLQTMTSLTGDLTRFEDISALDVDNADDFQLPNKKKRGSKPSKYKRKKFSKLKK